MTYVLADIHGFHYKYLEFLQYTNFNDNDTLYIIGDVLDRGSKSIPLIQDIMKKTNVILIKGNHEDMLLPVLNDLMFESKEVQEQIINDEISISRNIGQEYTLRDFCKLTTNEQNEITYYISQLPLYEEIEVNGINFILVHAGLPNFSDMPIEYYDEVDLLFGPHDFEINHYGDGSKIVIGHTPTRFISGAIPDKIFHINDTIAIDCGCGFGGQLGVLSLDTGEELYF